jgi:hypothetical protein
MDGLRQNFQRGTNKFHDSCHCTPIHVNLRGGTQVTGKVPKVEKIRDWIK